ncbi:MAG: LPS export ABC transporter permease LptG [Gammaproteobacteria bacterium]|nr:LPS export ABC transporter permease LptG [Gammaproteobacteria bacterium]
MKIFEKYLGKTVITYVFIVALVLLAVRAFIEFSNEFPDIGSGNYGILQVFLYVPMMLPLDVYEFFPMAGLLGCILGLGLLASHSELIVMQCSGLSLVKITWAVVKAAILLVAIMFFVGEVLAPIAERIAIENKTTAVSGGQTYFSKEGVWVKSETNFVHIDKVLTNGKLEGVTRYALDDNYNLELISFAENASYQDNQWTFYNVAQTNFVDNKTVATHFPEQNWGFKLKPRLLDLTTFDPNQKSLVALYSHVKARKQSGLDATHYEFIFWQRIFQPLASLVMILLAIPFVFGPLRSATTGLRMLAGVMLGFAFYILNQFAGPMSAVYHVPPFVAALFPILCFFVIGGLLVLRARQ